MENLIIVKQLPQIEEHLKELSTEIEQKVKNAKSLVCTEDTVKEVKQVRADLNKEFKEVEQQRKAVKEQVLAPYMQFEEIYKTYISDKYKSADSELKTKVDAIEGEVKKAKKKEVYEYFYEYRDSLNIDFVDYEKANINVTLTASMKSLKEQAKIFLDKVADDLKLIETQEHKAEILVEYKQTLNVSNAITTVTNRFKDIEEEKARQEELKRKQLEEQQKIVNESIKTQSEAIKQAIENSNATKIEKPLQAPKEEKQEEILTLNFKVKDTKTKLKELKKFLDDGGYDYE